MKLGKSLHLGKIAGVHLFVHWTFLILIGWIFFMHFQMGLGIRESVSAVGFVVMVFVCVILHEFGHALMAQRFNIATKSITILPIGGLASIEKMPEKPSQELLVAFAGPMVNVVIGSVLYSYLVVTGVIPSTPSEILKLIQDEGTLIGGRYFLVNLMIANVTLVLFNLIPALPMDGGRVFRALLSYLFDRKKATVIAARIGQLISIVFVIVGLYVNVLLVFIGVFIFIGAGSEALYETTRNILSGYKVRDVLMTNYTLLSVHDTLGKVVDIILQGQEQEFLVMNDQTVIGVLTSRDIITGLSRSGKETSISEVLKNEFPTFYTDTELKDVYQTLISKGYSIGPVFENSKLAGVVNMTNINEFIMINQALQRKILSA